MMESNEAERRLEELLKPLKIQFQKELVERVATLSKCRTKLYVDNNSDTLEEISSLAHKLAGAGTTFGFPNISIYGKDLERAILFDSDVDLSKIEKSLDILINECENSLI